MENRFQVNNIVPYEHVNDYASSDDDQVSDCESTISSPGNNGDRVRGLFVEDDLVRLDEDDAIFRTINRRFMWRLGDLGNNTTVVEIRRKNWSSSLVGQARLRCFEIFAQTLANRRDKFANNKVVKFAWYGGSKQEIARIMSHGFGHREIRDDIRPYGHGICLSPVDYPAQSVQTCVVDDDGLRHVLLCRVILGNTESVDCDSSQFNPSSDEFDSGVDDVRSPRNYVIWSNKMNTHILPEYVITFRAPHCLKGFSRVGNLLKKKPTSPWMPFPTLISVLSKHLPSRTMNVIGKHYKDLKDRRISRRELVKKVRGLAGDDLLISIIKSCQAKK